MLNAVLAPTSGLCAEGDDLAIGTQLFAPGDGTPAHIHHTYAEVIIVMSGCLTLTIEGQALQLRAGDKSVIAAGAVHEARNTTDEDAIVTYVKAPYDPADTTQVTITTP